MYRVIDRRRNLPNDREFDVSTVVVKAIYFALIATFVAFAAFGFFQLLIPFMIALVLALSLNPLISGLERYHVPRWISAIVVLVILVGAVAGVIYLLLPSLKLGIQHFQEDFELYRGRAFQKLGRIFFFADDLLRSYSDTTLAKSLQGLVEPFKNYLKGLLSAIPDLVTGLLITPIITAIFIFQGPAIFKNSLAMVPNRYFEMSLLLVKRIREQITSYIKGLAIQFLLLTAIMAPGFAFVKVPYYLLVAVAAAAVNIVPYIGPLFGMALAVTVASIGPVQPGADPNYFWMGPVIVWGAAQLVDNFFTQPVVLSKSVRIHPLISILAIITAFALQSTLLVVLAIPLAGILIVSIQLMHRSLRAFRVI